MKRLSPWCVLLLILPSISAVVMAQKTSSDSSATVFPRLIHFAGSLRTNGSSTKMAGVTFSLYSEESGGSPLWIETQNVAMDDHGRYEVLLGSMKPDGIPMELFTSGEARWLGIRVDGGLELPRVLLVSVPYAVKALDAERLGGKPPAAFALAQGGSQSTATGSSKTAASESSASLPTATITGSGTADFLSRWTGASSLGTSLLYQGPNGNFGIGTTTPGAKFSVFLNTTNGTAIRGTSVASSGGVGVEGVTGLTTADPANMAAVMGLNQSKFGVAGLFNTTSVNSWILEGQYNGKEVFYVDPSGRVSANTGLFSTPNPGPAVTGYSTYNNCVSTNACSYGTLSGGAGVMGVGGGNGSAGLFNSQGTGLVLEGTNKSNADVFTVSNTGFVHAGSLVVDGINNTDVNGLQAFAFGSAATGVYGEADSSGNVGVNGFSENGIGVLGQSATSLSARFSGSNPGDGYCNFDNNGNMGCTGTVSAVVPLSDQRKVALYAVQSPENWSEDFGSGQLRAGIATVVLDPGFAQTVNANLEYHVFVTPNGECRGLYVSSKSPSAFEVRELNGGQSDTPFDYRIVVRRKGFEALRLQDLTKREAAARAATAKRIQPPPRNISKAVH